MAHDTIYNTKHEAERKLAMLKSKHGGLWHIEKIDYWDKTFGGERYRVYQSLTRERHARDMVKRQAEITLSVSFSVFFVTSYLEGEKKRLEEHLEKFRAEFTRNPFSALEWGIDVCQAAANYNVVKQMLSAFKRGRDERNVCEYFETEAALAGEFGSLSGSTSPMANLMDRAKTIALRKYSKILRNNVDARARALGDLYAVNENLI